MPDHRKAIITNFATWTALSALRSGSRVKSRDLIYPLLREAGFERLLEASPGSITSAFFADWHVTTVAQFRDARPELCVGWAAKLINVYLKTAVYVGGLGPPELIARLHPPIDGGLWRGLETPLKSRPAIRERTHCVQRISQIVDYGTYSTIVGGCRDLASELGCHLIEVEQFWAGAAAPSA